jgi:predicted nucleic acid-binding protein
MALALFDTNFLVDLSNGIPEALTELAYFSDRAISSVSYMEFMIGARAQLLLGKIQVLRVVEMENLARGFPIIHVDGAIADETILVRSDSLVSSRKSIKLPDAIIIATAKVTGRRLVSRDTRGFAGFDVRVPYQIDPAGRVINVSPPPSYSP